MILFKEQVAKYKEANSALEKENEEILDFKASITQQDPNCTLESHTKAMADSSLKEGEIKTLKERLAKKDTHITSLKETVKEKDTLISKFQATKTQVKAKWSKANENLIGKTPLVGAKHILWDQLSGEITKFREYLRLVDDEFTMDFKSMQRCKTINEDLVHIIC